MLKQKLLFYFILLGFLISPKLIFGQDYNNISDLACPNPSAPTFEQAKELYLRQVLRNPTNPKYNSYLLDTTNIKKTLTEMQLIDNYLSTIDSLSSLRCRKPKMDQSYRVKTIYLSTRTPLNLSKNENSEYDSLPVELDSFMKKYDFTRIFLSFDYPPDYYSYELQTDHEYNIKLILDELNQYNAFYDCCVTVRGVIEVYKFESINDSTLCTITGFLGYQWKFNIVQNVVTFKGRFGKRSNMKIHPKSLLLLKNIGEKVESIKD